MDAWKIEEFTPDQVNQFQKFIDPFLKIHEDTVQNLSQFISNFFNELQIYQLDVLVFKPIRQHNAFKTTTSVGQSQSPWKYHQENFRHLQKINRGRQIKSSSLIGEREESHDLFGLLQVFTVRQHVSCVISVYLFSKISHGQKL